jgi:hypothetical protein
MKNNPKKPFKIICTHCNATVELIHDPPFTREAEDIIVYGSPFYDAALVYVECDCGNEIEL